MRAIITFHSIDDTGSVISYPPSLFRKLLQSLDSKGIPVYDLQTLLQGKSGDGVALTFDDGMLSVYRSALPVLKEFSAPAHVFVTTGVIGTGRPWPEQPADVPSFDMMNWDQLEALSSAGIYIENHTHTHPDMRGIDADRMEEECSRADELIEQRLGRRPRFFAYPFGYHNRLAREVAARRFDGAVTTELSRLRPAEDSAALPRLDSYYLRSTDSIRRFDGALMGAYLGIRSRLRTLRGSQCTPGCD